MKKYIDLSIKLTENTAVYPGEPHIVFKQHANIKDNHYNEHQITINTHFGTHIDFPYHMIDNGKKSDEYDISRFIGSGVIIDAKNPDIKNLKGEIVLIYTGHLDNGIENLFDNVPVLDENLVNNIINKSACSTLNNLVKLILIFSKTADKANIEKYINSLGLAHNKSKNIKSFAEKLAYEFEGKLPSDKKVLITFPGIGNKSAGVIRAEVFKIPDLPVDTHILRISNRLQLTNSANPDVVEQDLKNLIPKEKWIQIHHQLIHFGRYFCTARNPKCQNCKIKSYCINSIN